MRAPALLALLPAFAAAGALVAVGEAAHEQDSGECEAAMRVELLQKFRSAATQSEGMSTPTDRDRNTLPNALTKSVLAISRHHTGKSLAFKRFFLPVETEQESMGTERNDFLISVRKAIEGGAALPDETDNSAEKFDPVAWTTDCGKGARVRLRTVLGEGMDRRTYMYGSNMSHFSFHGVYAEGNGSLGGSHREVGDLTVREVERIYQEELGDMREYSPWMDTHAALYDNDLDSYARRFFDHDVPVLALKWPSADRAQSLYSLIVHVPDTQEVFEIVSASAPSYHRLVLREFSMTRHVFQQDELRLLVESSGPTQLHVSRSHYDLDAVKAHYRKFLQVEPLHEVRDADTGVSFVSFWHQSAAADQDVIRVQVMYWNRPDQSMTVAHTTEWLERRLERLNSQYMRSYTSCWPIWADNHYTLVQVSGDYWSSVRRRYDDAGIGYMLFGQVDGDMFAGYFPLPGGMYIELHPNPDDAVPIPEGLSAWRSDYCYPFTCPA